MSMLILCTGKPLSPVEGNYTAADFDAAVSASLESAAEAPSERKIAPGGRKVMIGEGLLARSTMEQLLEPCDYQVEPLLNEIPVRSSDDTDRPLSAQGRFPAESRRPPATRVSAGRQGPRRHADPFARGTGRRFSPHCLSAVSDGAARPPAGPQLCDPARRPLPASAAGEDRCVPEGRALRRLPA